MVLGLDFETYSEADIGKVGSYRYIEDPSFEPLLVAYAYDDEVPTVIDLTIEPMPQQLLEDMLNPDILKTAWNVAFERKVLHRAWGVYSPPEQWQDTMILAGVNGLPMSLGGCGKALMLPQDSAKDAEGKRLIKYFCSPCKPSKVNKGRTRNLPEHAPLKWEKFIEYNRQDVVAERAIRKILEKQYVPDETERQFWCLDSRINWNGINIDTQLAEQAVRLSERNTAELTEQAVAVTGLSNPGSIQQVKEWLEAQEGIEIPSLNKKSVADVVAALTSDRAKEFMTLRSELAKTSVKKYEAMVRCCGEDHHAKGCFAFYGANRTGRFAGRLIQLQNLPQNHMEDLDECRQLVKAGDYDSVQFLWGSISNPLSELIRTALIPEDGCKWVVADFSAIEARVIAWIAQETWRLETFRNGGDIYCASASQMFKVPVEKHGQNAHLRQKGKVAELACIAEGQLVLTDKGLVPIEQVTTDHKVWDGIEWVNHEGVVYRGEKEVLSYGGLEGTEDHIVWATIRGQARKIRLGDAAARGAHLIQAGDGRSPIRVGEDYKPGEEMGRLMESLLRSDGMHGMRTAAMDQFYQSEKRQIKRMSELLTATDCSALVRQKVYCGKAEMREPKRRKLQKLWSKRNKVLLQQRNRSLPLYDRKLWNPIKRDGAGQNRCGWKLRSGKSQMGYPPGELPKPEKVLKKVYDIRNAGPRHRFTVSGILVHNCGYGGGVNALKAFGADKMGLTEEEMGQIISDWRASSPRIVQLWRSLENAFIRCIRDKVPTRSTIGGICFNIRDGVGWMTLPSGRKIAYPGVTYAEGNGKYSTGRKIISFMGVNQLTKKWERIETFGGRITENLVQATARDCLRDCMMALDAEGYDIRAHVHDEVIISEPRDSGRGVKDVVEIMSRELPWAKGLPLTAAGYEGDYYFKD